MNRQQRRRLEREQQKLLKGNAAAGHAERSSGSTRRQRAQSLSRDLQAAEGVALNERFDNYVGLRNGLRHIAHERENWAGIPMPLEGHDLVIEPNFPGALALEAMTRKEEEPLPDDVKFRNRWWSKRYRCEIYVYEEAGKVRCAKLAYNSAMTMELNTLGCSSAWGLEQEANAVKLLGTLVRHHQLKTYLLTGMFLESSKRSGLTYLFRKLRPTVVIDARTGSDRETSRILCALCLHPIGFYSGTWAGAMCPTDDVIAHLMLMRGDEPMLWRRANQHAPGRPEAAI